ncbi:MAG: DUF1648 domain-containing protein [Candidatus Shapirobacteria bacterium]|jgi:uncharacterized membrane protein
MKKNIPIFIIALSFLLGFYFYPKVPELVATHWGASGQVDGYSPKAFGLFFMPILLIGLYLLFRFLPSTDPYKKNFKQFEHHFNNFVVIIFIFLFYLFCLTLIWNSGYQFNMVQFLAPAFALLFYYTGVLTSVAKRNWFVGIRTPWTMSSDIVWDKTHAIGGKLFKAVGVISLAGILFPGSAALLIFLPVIFASIFVFAYSYYLYQKENHES